MCEIARFRFRDGRDVWVESTDDYRRAFGCEPRFEAQYGRRPDEPVTEEMVAYHAGLLGGSCCCCPIDWDRSVPLIGFKPGKFDPAFRTFNQVPARAPATNTEDSGRARSTPEPQIP